mmetsp:Transcript_6127/g.14755  ORF Transcript_6127/g.14755 Transcript_6127/m.14755 type:complete len:114 (-) Transcript_6127:476-817(-)
MGEVVGELHWIDGINHPSSVIVLCHIVSAVSATRTHTGETRDREKSEEVSEKRGESPQTQTHTYCPFDRQTDMDGTKARHEATKSAWDDDMTTMRGLSAAYHGHAMVGGWIGR